MIITSCCDSRWHDSTWPSSPFHCISALVDFLYLKVKEHDNLITNGCFQVCMIVTSCSDGRWHDSTWPPSPFHCFSVFVDYLILNAKEHDNLVVNGCFQVNMTVTSCCDGGWHESLWAPSPFHCFSVLLDYLCLEIEDHDNLITNGCSPMKSLTHAFIVNDLIDHTSVLPFVLSGQILLSSCSRDNSTLTLFLYLVPHIQEHLWSICQNTQTVHWAQRSNSCRWYIQFEAGKCKSQCPHC